MRICACVQNNYPSLSRFRTFVNRTLLLHIRPFYKSSMGRDYQVL